MLNQSPGNALQPIRRLRGPAALLLGLCAALPAAAGEYVATLTAPPLAVETLEVRFAGDGLTVETEISLDFDPTFITIGNPVPSNGALCGQPAASRLRIIPPSGGFDPLPEEETTYCSYTVTIAADAPQGLIPFSESGIECSDATAQAQPCTLRAGAGINVAGEAQPRTLGYAPAVGTTIAFAGGGAIGEAAPGQTIAVTATGGFGSAELADCSIAGSGAASFSVTPTRLDFATSGTQQLALGCTYAAADASASLDCTEIDGDTPAPGATRSFPLLCPAAAPPPTINPTILSSPPSGGVLTTSTGPVGTLGLATLGLFATGGSGAGSTTISCTSTGVVRIAASPGTPTGQGPIIQTVVGSAQPSNLRVGVFIAASAQLPAGSVFCTVSGQAPIIVSVNAPAAGTPGPIVSPPPPSGPPPQAARPIPGVSTWSLGLLLGLFAIAGLWAVSARRPS